VLWCLFLFTDLTGFKNLSGLVIKTPQHIELLQTSFPILGISFLVLTNSFSVLIHIFPKLKN
jgi:hypothetical protein